MPRPGQDSTRGSTPSFDKDWDANKKNEFKAHLDRLGRSGGSSEEKSIWARQWEAAHNASVTANTPDPEASELEREQLALFEEQRKWLQFQREGLATQQAEAQAEKDEIAAERKKASDAQVSKLKARSRRRLALTQTGSSGVLSSAPTGRNRVLGN